MQCPECGRDAPHLVGGACPNCAAARRTFLQVPETVDASLCAHCGRLRRGAHWEPVPADRDALTRTLTTEASRVDPDVAQATLEHEIHWEDARHALVTIRLTGDFHGEAAAGAAQTRLRLKSDVCNECSRRYGGYFESIIQVRAHDEHVLERRGDGLLRQIEDDLARFQAEQRTGAYVNRAETVRGGYDFYVGSVEVGRLVAQHLVQRTGAVYAESKSIAGRRNGQDVYRYTLLVRLPPYLAGDFIEFDGRLCKVLRQERKLLTMWDFERGDKIQREPKRAKTLKVVGRLHEETDAVVVSRNGQDVQLLDPVTLRTVDLRVEWDLGDRETVRVFRYDDTLHVVPPDAQVAAAHTSA